MLFANTMNAVIIFINLLLFYKILVQLFTYKNIHV